MKPFPLYHLFRPHFAALLPALVETVTGAAAPDCIFLLGASLNHQRTESLFTGPAPAAQHIAGCTLLVLLPEMQGKEAHQWQDKIEAHCRASLLPVTALVVSTGRFQQWLRDGNRFALQVLLSAEKIYDAGTAVLPLPGSTTVPPPGKDEEKTHTAALARAAEFLAGAELFFLRKHYALSAFLLHQSAEQALSTLVCTGTGFSPHTHSLERLLRYAALVSCRLPALFPQQSERDKRLFRLLQKAYTDTRYADYTISAADLLLLTRRVKALYELVAVFGKQVFSPNQATATT